MPIYRDDFDQSIIDNPGAGHSEPESQPALIRRLFEYVDRIADQETRELVRKDLSEAMMRPGDLPLSDRLMEAYRLSVSDRVGQSDDPHRRDAEYFLLGLSAGLNREVAMVFFTQVTGPIYDTVKDLSHVLKDAGFPALEMWLRADKSQPTSLSGDGPAMARAGFSASFGFDPNRAVVIPATPRATTPDMGLPRFP